MKEGMTGNEGMTVKEGKMMNAGTVNEGMNTYLVL